MNKGNSDVKQSFDHIVTVRKSVPGVRLSVINCQSISGKLDFVFDHIKEYQLDIMALTETWLSSEDSKNKHVFDQCVAHGYTLHHSPRTSGRRWGGVGLLVSNAIKVTVKQIHVSPLITSFELMEAVLTICSVSLRVIVVPTTPACTWWNRPEEDLSSGKSESTHPSRTVVKSIEVFYGVESVVRGNADSLLN